MFWQFILIMEYTKEHSTEAQEATVMESAALATNVNKPQKKGSYRKSIRVAYISLWEYIQLIFFSKYICFSFFFLVLWIKKKKKQEEQKIHLVSNTRHNILILLADYWLQRANKTIFISIFSRHRHSFIHGQRHNITQKWTKTTNIYFPTIFFSYFDKGMPQNLPITEQEQNQIWIK